jgi:hypothetical protein
MRGMDSIGRLRPRRLGVQLAVSGLLVAAAAGAAMAADPSLPAGLKRLIACRQVADKDQRLACYDAAVDALTGQLDKGEVVAVDKDQAREVRRQAFGFRMPSISLFERGEKPEEVDRLTATVADAHQRGDGKWVLELEDGAVWTQIDAETLSKYPKKGSKVEIRKASLGTYFINIDGQRAIRAQRTR